MKNLILQAVALLVSVGAFLLGKYVFPNVSKSVTAKLRELAAWADKFVVWAREFHKQASGHDKMEMVVEQLQAVAKEAGWDVTEDQLRAIAQAAYENMMAGAAEAEAAQDADKAKFYEIGQRKYAEASTVVINVPAGVPVPDNMPGVAVAVDEVPEGALDVNQDGSVNVYDAAGQKVGTVDAATAEALAAGVGVVIIPGQQQEAAQAAQEAGQEDPEDAGGTTTAQAAEAPQNGQETQQDGQDA